MPARLLLLCLLFRSSWLTVEGGRGRRRHSAASPGRTGSRGRVGRRGWWRSGAVVSMTGSRGSRECRIAPAATVWSTTPTLPLLCLLRRGSWLNDGADRPVAGARVLHRRGRLAAVAASVGVALRVPNREVVASPVRTPAYAHSSACAQWRGQSVGHRSRVPDRHRRQEALMGSFPDALAPIVQ